MRILVEGVSGRGAANESKRSIGGSRGEVVAAGTHFASDVRFEAALGAAFAPFGVGVFLGFWRGGGASFFGAELEDSGGVGLFDRALGMDAAEGIRRLSANGAEVFGSRVRDDDAGFAGHRGGGTFTVDCRCAGALSKFCRTGMMCSKHRS